MTSDLLLSFYGDDFTGSTDAMEALSLHGVPAVLFVQPPEPHDLAAFPDCRAVGVAGISRSQSPQWMARELPAVFDGLRALGAPLCHYKVCSTFDSAPQVGSIGRAIDIARPMFGGDFIPLVVGAPALRRYTAFGNLFATLDGTTHRIDRHPVMNQHPVTPMDEGDVRRHLARQTDKTIGLVDVIAFRTGTVDQQLERVLADGAQVVMFDVLDEDMQAEVGRILWQARSPDTTFVAGSSGVEYALAAHWMSTGVVTRPRSTPRASNCEQLAVVSGSCSPVTEAQIRWALAQGFAGVELDAAKLVSHDHLGAVERACEQAMQALREGRSGVLYTALGRGSGFIDPADNLTQFNDLLGRRIGEILGILCRHNILSRIVVAGGDTSGHAVNQLDMFALTLEAPLVPGAPLCRVHSRDAQFDRLQVVLKGGQVGGAAFFGQVREGRA